MNKPKLSFCIPTYNREKMVAELVEEILNYKGDDIEIIVVDNDSSDGTVDAINNLQKKDNRVKLIKNEKNIGPVQNWYKSLLNGSGEWLFQVMDRDWIVSSLIPELLDILEFLESEEAGFAVAGEVLSEEKCQLHDIGIDGITTFGLRASHPTGAIFNRGKWLEFDTQEQIWDKEYTIYPHGYCFAYLASKYKSAFITIDICDRKHYNERKITTKSHFYEKPSGEQTTNTDAWFLPENRYKLLLDATEHIGLFVQDEEIIREFIKNAYYRTFWNVTIENWGVMNDAITRMRYDCDCFEINYLQLMTNGFDCIINYRMYLENSGYNWVTMKFMKELLAIETAMLSQMYNFVTKLLNG